MEATSTLGAQEPPPFEDIPFVPEKGFYQPSSEETWEAYQALLTVVQYQSRVNCPGAVLCGVADEVLSVLKSNNIKTLAAKKAEIEKILNPFPDFIFDQLVSTADLITDYYAVRGRSSKIDDRIQMFVCEEDLYQPKREDTLAAYKLLIDFVNDQLGCGHPQMVECIVAHEVLVILKDTLIQNSVKREMIANTLNLMSDDKFEMLLSIARLITDFTDGEDVGTGNELYDGATISNRTAPIYDYYAPEASDDETMNSCHATDVVGSSTTIIEDECTSVEEEIMCHGIENVRIADKEAEGDWVMVDFDLDM